MSNMRQSYVTNNQGVNEKTKLIAKDALLYLDTAVTMYAKDVYSAFALQADLSQAGMNIIKETMSDVMKQGGSLQNTHNIMRKNIRTSLINELNNTLGPSAKTAEVHLQLKRQMW